MHNLLNGNFGLNAAHIDINELAEIQNVKIDTSLPKKKRMESFIRQIKNPYCYRCDDTIVHVSFADTGATLEERLKQYLLSGRCSALL